MDFIKQTLDEIRAGSNSNRFYNKTFYLFSKLGLHQIAKREQMLNIEEYENPKARDSLLEKIREFITRQIK